MIPKPRDKRALTFHEHRLINMKINQGLEYKEIASILNLSPNTIRNNFQYIYKKISNYTKLPVGNASELKAAYGAYIYEKNIDMEEVMDQINGVESTS